MNVLIFSVGCIIFFTYMFFLLKMINKTHKDQDREEREENRKQFKKILEKWDS